MGDALKTLQIVPTVTEEPRPGKRVSRSHLVNRLNYINFQDQSILVSLRHLVYDDAVFLKAKPLPCAGERLDCLWAETPGLSQLLKTYRFDYLLIADGKKYLLVNSELVTLNESGLGLILPVNCHEFQARRIRRHPAREVSVQLLQHGALFDCRLVDFTPVSLRVSGKCNDASMLKWINRESPVHVRLLKGGRILYSGNYEILSQQVSGKLNTMVLGQLHGNMHRFKNKKYRNIRQQLVPSPNIVFEHPLINKRVNLKIADISGTGFSVEENEGDCVLMPGMMLPDLKITFAQGVSLDCLAQVVFRNVTGEGGGEGTVKCGVAILDMSIEDHVTLLSILHQVADTKSYVCTDVDLNELWDFFFETGFIYPGKYAHFQANKERIKETYAKLYTHNPHIARHFIYLDRGAILGHLAMVRFYRSAWLIHHHAARKTVSVKAGLAVLDQVTHYLNELESYAFANLRFVYCYYRPDNKFPSRVFGGFARQYTDPRICSQDEFAYSHFKAQGEDGSLAQPWEIGCSSLFDLTEAGSFYRYASGGLMTQAFDVFAGAAGRQELEEQYQALGFRKELYLYSLRKNGSLKAFFLVSCTDAGFNMAELTNCVTMLVLDEEVPYRVLELSLGELSRHYESGEMPVLTYPVSYLEKEAVPYDKVYLLWVLNMQYSDQYLQYCQGLFRTVKKPS
ncbi:MAG TPA: pilus assembly protein PilZ [Geobacter sp.]|nr:pilus assembly protein PilZ [Geobacter sp.]